MVGLAGMMMAGLLASGGAPDMRVTLEGLDLARPEGAQAAAGRIRSASRDWCAAHRGFLTPDALGAPQVCEQEMRRRAYRQIPPVERRLFVRAGGHRALTQP